MFMRIALKVHAAVKILEGSFTWELGRQGTNRKVAVKIAVLLSPQHQREGIT